MDEIQKVRKEITEIDRNILILLKKRQEKAKLIGDIKKSKNMPVFDKNREKEILDSLDNDFEVEIFKKILSESRKLQL